jgi:hypothetical protein
MSRSGYIDDWEDYQRLNLYRGNVWRATVGKRGQALLREMAAALDAMPVRELVAGEIVRDEGHVCALGAVALARGLDVSQLDPTDGDEVGKTFGVASCLVREIAYENDEGGNETPAQRWKRMRAWVEENLTNPPTSPR